MNKLHRTLALSLLLGGSMLAGTAHAVPIARSVTLNGASEVPSNVSVAVGTGTITIDDSLNTISWNITQNVAGANGAHIHGPAVAGVNAGIIRPLYSGTVPSNMVGTYVIGRTPIDTLGQLLHDSTYVNIHSGAFPGGEIRGQVRTYKPVPSISEWGMMMLSLALVLAGGVYLKRRRFLA